MDEFRYIPPQQQQRLQRSQTPPPESPKFPDFPEFPELAEPVAAEYEVQQPHTPSELVSDNAFMVAPSNVLQKRRSSKKPKKCTSSLKRKTQRHTSTGSRQWTALGDGFSYAPGPVVPKLWRQWTWRDTVGELARWALLCCAVYWLLCMIQV